MRSGRYPETRRSVLLVPVAKISFAEREDPTGNYDGQLPLSYRRRERLRTVSCTIIARLLLPLRRTGVRRTQVVLQSAVVSASLTSFLFLLACTCRSRQAGYCLRSFKEVHLGSRHPNTAAAVMLRCLSRDIHPTHFMAV